MSWENKKEQNIKIGKVDIRLKQANVKLNLM